MLPGGFRGTDCYALTAIGALERDRLEGESVRALGAGSCNSAKPDAQEQRHPAR
jgi:hypothetical protein